MSTIKLVAVALIAFVASFTVQTNPLLAQSDSRSYENEPLEIIPNANSVVQQYSPNQPDFRPPADFRAQPGFRPQVDFRPQADYGPQPGYRAQAEYESRPYPPALRGQNLRDDYTSSAPSYDRRPNYRQPYRAAYQSELGDQQTSRPRPFDDRRAYETRRAQFAQDGVPEAGLPHDRDRYHPRSGRRGCRGGSCGHHQRRGQDEGQSLGNEISPYAEPPYMEYGPLNRSEADRIPQLGVYRPSPPYRN